MLKRRDSFKGEPTQLKRKVNPLTTPTLTEVVSNLTEYHERITKNYFRCECNLCENWNGCSESKSWDH